MFGVFVGAALFFRRRPAIHKRLMLLATVGPQLTGPPVIHAVGHWPALLPWFGVILLSRIPVFCPQAQSTIEYRRDVSTPYQYGALLC